MLLVYDSMLSSVGVIYYDIQFNDATSYLYSVIIVRQ